MLSRKNKIIVMKFISLFSVVRGYNIPIIVIAQYLSAIFILAPEKRALAILLDFDLFIIVLASSLAIASGYIINNFYDSKKDLINRPTKSMLDRLVSQKTKLNVYFTLNFIVVFLAIFVSWRAFLYFSVYIFLIWYYSHRIKKQLFLGNLMSAFLSVLPFFAVFLYYKNLYEVILGHAVFLFLLLLIRELVKDLENIKGDLANDYRTIPIVYGEEVSKKIITMLSICTIIPVYILIEVFDVGYMDIYFYTCLIILIFFQLSLWKSNTKEQYLLLHNVLKLLIVAGVFSIILINPSVLWHGKKLLQSI
ncbi:geranylgeranylglycerol-phosphate geranylgeranyltransferase [Flavobacterium sp.]|uniref:geranylgeranylglycerol-phosphate geranylgeranyltransferase n=1 Tax=Flavobacterium sp. TaxID=239 RepID=UPI0037C0A51C